MLGKKRRNLSAGAAEPVLTVARSSLWAFAFAIAPLPAAAQVKPAAPPVAKSDEAARPKGPKETPQAEPKQNAPAAKTPNNREGTMTFARMSAIIRRLDPKAKQPTPNSWQFMIGDRPVVIVTDLRANRMRILSPVAKLAGMPQDVLQRMLQANFDTALDARYAIARGIVWATYIHPLSELHDRQFISGIGQTVNLVLTFGKTFSSGAMSFGSGDSRDILRRKLIEDLQKKGVPI